LLFLDAAIVDFPARALRPEATPGLGQCKPCDHREAHDQERQMANTKLSASFSPPLRPTKAGSSFPCRRHSATTAALMESSSKA
jgi:hypothetical protein